MHYGNICPIGAKTNPVQTPSTANNYGMTADELANFRANNNGFSPMDKERRLLAREVWGSIPDRTSMGAHAWNWFQRQASVGGTATTTTVTFVPMSAYNNGVSPAGSAGSGTHTFTKEQARHYAESIPDIMKNKLLQLKSEAEEGSFRMQAILEMLIRDFSGSWSPSAASNVTAGAKNYPYPAPVNIVDGDVYDDSLTQALSEVMSNYRTRILSGGRLTQEEIMERITLFRERFAPEESSSEQQIQEFNKKLSLYHKHLSEIGTNDASDLVVVTPINNPNDVSIYDLMRSKFPSNPGLRYLLQN